MLPKTSDREIFADLPGKREEGKKGKIKKKARKIRWKIEKLKIKEKVTK